jgi:small-conductance mechanosensitive channel
MIPMVIIVIRLFGSLARWWMLSLIILFILTFIYELIYYPDIFLRMILLFFSLSAFSIFLWMIIRKPLSGRFTNRFLYGLFRIILGGFTLLLLIAIIGNLAGAFRMAEFFTLMTIQVVVLAIGIQVTIKVMDTLIFLLLASNSLQKLNVFRDEFRTVYRKTIRLINFFLWIFFIVTALNIFRIKDPFFGWGREVLTTGKKIGEVFITPANILIFIFVIWLSIFLSRIIRHILEKDVFARVSTSKGMPSTIILLARIGLITGGFFLAAAAAGMKLTNLSIVLGAFSVGIGFGLQNIFNNMVSGLILAFERPIKVGDTVQVGELLGVVLSIGLRSSTVRSFDGAEVIVPNGNLISDQMINWTLSDSYRRMDIRVGVAYGTDPEKVLDLMQEAAMENKQVKKYPAPTTYFIGFGDSSLDFRLLAWAHIDNRLTVESELNVAVNTKLKEAGIEIPFPQRDLHIRSDATKKN